MSKNIRTFVAVPLDEPVQKAVVSAQKELQTVFVDVAWVKAPQAHLTLQFLGDIDQAKANSAALTMKRHLSTFKAFQLELSGVGAFPNTRQPKILWIGLRDPQGILKNLADILAHELQMLGFPWESKEFKAHITIGRVRSNKNIRALSEKLSKVILPASIKCPVNEVVLFKSSLTSSGPIYEELSKIQLVSDD